MLRGWGHDDECVCHGGIDVKRVHGQALEHWMLLRDRQDVEPNVYVLQLMLLLLSILSQRRVHACELVCIWPACCPRQPLVREEDDDLATASERLDCLYIVQDYKLSTVTGTFMQLAQVHQRQLEEFDHADETHGMLEGLHRTEALLELLLQVRLLQLAHAPLVELKNDRHEDDGNNDGDDKRHQPRSKHAITLCGRSRPSRRL
mmetsp:Transcript_115258/g.298842  ORF Transcript_115258/g.298842 Transcript_115258/m.298842 type:complete len:204 (+) Transcript_115258:876-1487(+)